MHHGQGIAAVERYRDYSFYKVNPRKADRGQVLYRACRARDLGLKEDWFRDSIAKNPEVVIGPCGGADLEDEWSRPETPGELEQPQRDLAAATSLPWHLAGAVSSVAGCFVCLPKGKVGPGEPGDLGWGGCGIDPKAGAGCRGRRPRPPAMRLAS